MDRRGFTLIELSIVLVIIGLIVGGVLVGRDMIEAAQLRATIAQYEKYRSAVNAFRTKYNAIPGDLTTDLATALNMLPVTRTVQGSNGVVHGDGIVQGIFYSEAVFFWQDLSSASLIDGSFISATSSSETSVSFTGAGASSYFPATKAGQGYWIVDGPNGAEGFYYPSCSLNCYYLRGFAGTFTGGAGGYLDSFGYALTPVQAFSLDSKIDDGLPISGTVKWWTPLGYDNCYTGSGSYNTTGTYANQYACDIYLKF